MDQVTAQGSRQGRPFISMNDASFRLGERIIFENTTWILRSNEHWAITGGNGAGKTLFADALAGKLALIHGELRFHFRPPAGLSAEQSLVHVSFEDRKREARGLVAQSRWNSLEEECSLSVGEFLSFERVMEINPFEVDADRPLRRAVFETRRRRAVDTLQIASFLQRSLMSLSNGELQRVHLARALCHPTRLLILDEPYTGLDASARAHLHRVLQYLMGTRLRVLLIMTHEKELPQEITHALRLENCRVVASGPTKGRSFTVATRSSSRATYPERQNSDTGTELVR